jgi:hypothetical protein
MGGGLWLANKMRDLCTSLRDDGGWGAAVRDGVGGLNGERKNGRKQVRSPTTSLSVRMTDRRAKARAYARANAEAKPNTDGDGAAESNSNGVPEDAIAC